MTKILLCTAAFALSFAGVAAAQNAAPGDSAPAAAPPAASAPSAAGAAADSADATHGLKAGMSVTDSSGAAVGTISRIGKTADGTAAAELSVDGKTLPIALAALTLAPSGDHAVIAASKAQVQAALNKGG